MGSLENISILHVMLLIYLRLYIIKNPMSRNGPIKFRRLILVVTWLIPIILKLPVIFLWQYRYSFNIYMNIQFHLFSTLSVILIVLLYAKMLYTIRTQKLKNQKILNATRVAKEKGMDRKTTLMITGIVMVAMVCYLPYITHRTIDTLNDIMYFADNEQSKSSCTEHNIKVLVNEL